MSMHNEFEEHESIFWPGYVDAVVNLAINLLFVIAVLSIVVLGTTLQIAELSNKPQPAVVVEERPSKKSYDDALQALKKAEAAMQLIEKTVSEKDRVLLSTKTELLETRAALREAQVKFTQLQAAYQEATKATPDTSTGVKTTIRTTPSGTLITYGADLLEINAAETQQLLSRLSALGPLSSNNWRITVVHSKGVAEAARVANLRVQSIKNALLRNGVPASAIDVRLIETEQTTANNARVTVSIVR
ncbi:MAG: hypothetical protein RL297_1934 [Pseudomonadota bacterium]|jgi:Tfp pilus assembly protein PilX